MTKTKKTPYLLSVALGVLSLTARGNQSQSSSTSSKRIQKKSPQTNFKS